MNWGRLTSLKIEEIADVSLAADEARISVNALGLNRAEILLRQGRYLERPRLPSRVGYEASGVILEVGADAAAAGFAVGGKVSVVPCFSQARYGVYGETAVVPAKALAKYPENLSVVEAAGIWMQYLTAYGALLEMGKLAMGEFVLITAASSSVGYAAIQMAKAVGAISIACTRGANKSDQLIAAGADYVIVTGEQNLISEVEAITNGHGADLVFDAVAGPLLVDLAKACAYEARIYIYGALSMEPTNFPLQVSLKKGLSVNGYTMFQLTDDAKRFARAKDYIYKGLEDGTLKPVIDRVFDFEQIVEAQKYMETNQQNGKIIVKVKD